MSDAESGQVSADAAEIYEEFFVPALFEEAARLMVAAAGLKRDQRVLDVACGTGIVARVAAVVAGPAADIIGVDVNPAMLRIAQNHGPALTWRQARAEALPFDDDRFDAVFCQFGLMFFENREQALREMYRVAKPGGVLAVAVWDKVDNSPGYAAMTRLLERLFGAAPADAFRAPFALGDKAALAALLARAGVADAQFETLNVTARLPSLRSWVHTEIRGWTLAEMIDEPQFEQLASAANTELAHLVGPDGSVAFAAPAHLALARKPGP